jgi:Tol biopolymer transport system component
MWPDGRGVLYARSNLSPARTPPGVGAALRESRIEQVALEASNPVVLVDDAAYPGPAPDGSSLAFVRWTPAGVGLFLWSTRDAVATTVVPPGPFLALAYPRVSPDGQQLAFAAISRVSSAATLRNASSFGWLGALVVSAHGIPWEIWLVGPDGTNLRAVPEVLDDDPSVSWSPDGGKLLVYGGWGSYVIDATTGDVQSLPHLAGYGSTAWLAAGD